MDSRNSTSVYYEDDNPYIILKDGSQKFFPNLLEAISGLYDEYHGGVDSEEEVQEPE